MAKVDFGGLKQKLMTSIVAISAIQVLKAFMNIDKTTNTTALAWLVGIHVLFLGSLLVLAIVDRLESGTSVSTRARDRVALSHLFGLILRSAYAPWRMHVSKEEAAAAPHRPPSSFETRSRRRERSSG